MLVTAYYPGANSQTVRDVVAAPIEEQVSGVEGMMYMSSQAINDGTYRLLVTFNLGMDSDMAQVLVQNRVSLALPVIPILVQNEGITVEKMSPNTLMIVNLVSPDGRYDSTFLSNYATIYIRDKLGRLPGIADISYFGQRDYSLRAWLDPGKLASLGFSAADVVAAISQQNLQVAAGQIGQEPAPEGQQFQLTVNTLGRLTDVEQFANIILKAGGGSSATQADAGGAGGGNGMTGSASTGAAARPAPQAVAIVRLRDVARVELGSQQYDQTCTLDGKPSVALNVFQLPGTNAIQTARRSRQDGGAEEALRQRPGLQDRLRHHPLYRRVGQGGLLHPGPRRDPGGPGDAGLLAELAGGDHPPGRRAGGHRRHLRRHGRPGFFAQQPLAVRAGAGDRDRRERRDRGRGKHRALARIAASSRAKRRGGPWTRSPGRSSPSAWCCSRSLFRPPSWEASAGSSSANSP